MKVKELIEILRTKDPELTVIVHEDERGALVELIEIVEKSTGLYLGNYQ